MCVGSAPSCLRWGSEGRRAGDTKRGGQRSGDEQRKCMGMIKWQEASGGQGGQKIHGLKQIPKSCYHAQSII